MNKMPKCPICYKKYRSLGRHHLRPLLLMSKSTPICDRCHKEVTDKTEVNTNKVIVMSQVFDFCNGCETKFKEFIKEGRK